MDLKREEEIGGGWEELGTNHRRRQQSSAAEKGEGDEAAVYNSGHGEKKGGNHSVRAISRHLPRCTPPDCIQRNAQFGRIGGARFEGRVCISGAWLGGRRMQPNKPTCISGAWPRVESGNQSCP
jgi:hypothetical protein